jgi:hypothetical protein
MSRDYQFSQLLEGEKIQNVKGMSVISKPKGERIYWLEWFPLESYAVVKHIEKEERTLSRLAGLRKEVDQWSF